MGNVDTRSRLKTLRKPWVILISIVIGVAIGSFSKEVSTFLEPFGKMYLLFLKMCVIPILFCAIVSSFGMLIKTKDTQKYLWRLVVSMIIMFSISSFIGAAFGFVGKPGAQLDEKSKEVLGSIVTKSQYAPDLEINLSNPQLKEKKVSLLQFFTRIIPANIFQSLYTGKTLEILFFSIILGLALGYMPNDNSNMLIQIFATLFETFQKIIHWAMYGLPFGLICLLSGQISKVGLDILLSMVKFIVIFYLAGITLSIINYLIIWKKSGQSIRKTYQACVHPTIIALATTNSFATLPSAIDALIDLKFKKNVVNLFTPVGVTIGRYGNIMFFALATLFVAQIYNIQLGMTEYIIVLVGAVLAGVATTGATGIVTLSMISIVLGPLNLPVETVLIIFIAIDPIIDPLRSLLIVNTNMAATAIIAVNKKSVAGGACIAADEELVTPA